MTPGRHSERLPARVESSPAITTKRASTTETRVPLAEREAPLRLVFAGFLLAAMITERSVRQPTTTARFARLWNMGTDVVIRDKSLL